MSAFAPPAASLRCVAPQPLTSLPPASEMGFTAQLTGTWMFVLPGRRGKRKQITPAQQSLVRAHKDLFFFALVCLPLTRPFLEVWLCGPCGLRTCWRKKQLCVPYYKQLVLKKEKKTVGNLDRTWCTKHTPCRPSTSTSAFQSL